MRYMEKVVEERKNKSIKKVFVHGKRIFNFDKRENSFGED
jgi:hypothetical protein